MINDYGVLESRGYRGTINYSVDFQCWHGKIVGISDLVTYEADSYVELVEEFKDAILEYIDYLQWRDFFRMRTFYKEKTNEIKLLCKL